MNIDEIRAELLRAVEADVARRRRRHARRWIAWIAAAGCISAAGTLSAAATMLPLGLFGPKAPDYTQGQFDELGRKDLPGLGPITPGQAVEVARAGDEVLSVTPTDAGGFCMGTKAGVIACHPRPQDGPPIWYSLHVSHRVKGVPGKPDQEFRAYVAGRVSAPGAETVEIDTSPGHPPLQAAVGNAGFFLVEMSEDTYRASGQDTGGTSSPAPGGPPIGHARAFDAAGQVIAVT